LPLQTDVQLTGTATSPTHGMMTGWVSSVRCSYLNISIYFCRRGFLFATEPFRDTNRKHSSGIAVSNYGLVGSGFDPSPYLLWSVPASRLSMQMKQLQLADRSLPCSAGAWNAWISSSIHPPRCCAWVQLASEAKNVMHESHVRFSNLAQRVSTNGISIGNGKFLSENRNRNFL
jgi:hypothetical protein